MRGRDPDAPEVFASDLSEDFEAVETMLEAIAREGGIDLSVPLEPAPISLEEVRLERAARDLAKTVGGSDRTLTGATNLVVQKTARIATHLGSREVDEAGAAVWPQDAIGNLLLLDHLKRDLSGLLVARGRLDALEVLARLEALLLPLIASVERYRPVLDDLIASNRAPSPFLTTQGRPIA